MLLVAATQILWILDSCDRASWNVWWREVNQRDATNPMFIIKLLSQHVSVIIMPIIRRTRPCITAYGVLHWLCWLRTVVVWIWVVSFVHCVKVTVRLSNLHTVHTAYDPAPHNTHKRPPPVLILGQPNPVHIPTSHLLETHSNIIHPSTPRSNTLHNC